MAKTTNDKDGTRALATNRSASHEFHLLKRIEAGIVLSGPEVKSARAGRVQLKESYARIRDGEIFLHRCHISPYENSRIAEYDPVRTRKLLLHAREIHKLAKELEGSGVTLVPTRMYLRNGRVKVEIALARGKKLYDKRESNKKAEQEREIARATSGGRD